MVASLEATPPKCATAPSRPPCPSTTRTRSQRLQQENVLISGHSCTPPENGLARMTYNASSRPCPYGRASGSTTRLLEPPANRALPGLMSSVRPRRRCSHILRYAPGSRCAGTSPDLSCGPPGTMRFCTCCLSATFTCTNGNSSFLTCARVRQALRKSFCAAASRLCL